jgi:fucose-1-phosphate guanylyltransferase
MNKNYELYEKLILTPTDQVLELESLSSTKRLWDLIVITAISAEQKRCYEKQIQTKLERKRIPARFKYVVLNDPDNIKIGSGGSTLNVAKQLFLVHGEDLFKMKILLIHAGGYSQRMPTCTVLGKIFSPVACQSPFINDILDLKLAIYTPFSVNMQPGIFLTSSDDFQTFLFDEQIEASRHFGLDENDFTLIAHESSLNIAKDHGVYVLDEKIDSNSFNMFKCKFVLQKPSIQKMRDLDIVLKKNDSEYVYTDSVFYFSHRVTRDLISFYDSTFDAIKANKVEVDGYRDFLQPLGTKPLDLNSFLSSIKKGN